jgi:ABC-type transporter Mla MlaB component
VKSQMLQYYMHDGPSAFRFELSGDLDGEAARRLDQDWRTASSVMDGRSLVIDMTFVTGVDAAGRALLARWHRGGAQIVAKSKRSAELAEMALGKPVQAPPRVMRPARDATWTPFQTSLSAIRKIVSYVSGVDRPAPAENSSNGPAAASADSFEVRAFRASGDRAARRAS